MTDCMNKKVSIKWNRREMKSYTVGFQIMYVLTLFRYNSKIRKGRECDLDTAGAVP